MRTVSISKTYDLEMSEHPLPLFPDNGALIQVTGCGFCGSDLDKLLHQKSVPGSILGHEVVGKIAQLGSNTRTPLQVGERVVVAHHVPCGKCHYCINLSPSMCPAFKASNIIPGGFSEYIAVSEAHLQHTIFPIPEGISGAEASCIEPLACVLRAIQRAPFQQNGSALVIGLGFIGLMAAQWYQQLGYLVYGLDLQPERIALGREHHWLNGANTPQQTAELLSQIKSETPVGQVDTVFLSAVNAKTIETALQFVRPGGSLVLFASDPSPTASLHPSTLYFKEIQVIPSYSPSLESLQLARDLIYERTLEVAPLITDTCNLETLPKAYKAYQQQQSLKLFVSVTEQAVHAAEGCPA